MAKKEITKIVSNDPKLSDVITVEDLFKAWSESYTRIVDALERE